MKSTRKRLSQRFRGQRTANRRRVFVEQLEQRALLAAAPLEAALIDLHGEDLQGKDGPLAKAGLNLTMLYHEYRDYMSSSDNADELQDEIEFEPSNDTLYVDAGRVVVDIVGALATDADASPGERVSLTDEPAFYDLIAQGLEVTGQWGAITSVLSPIPLIPALAALDGVQSLMASAAVAHAGIVDSQGDAAQRSDRARDNLGVDGSGITVGVLSDSYDTNTSFFIDAADDIATGDLPGPGNPLGRTTPVNVLQDAPFSGIDEGRAMLQIVHDVAPAADLAFNTAVLGQAGFAQGILNLATVAGSDVIVDDIIYFAEPMFQDGVIAQAVDQVVDMGVPYFSSAGNANRTSYESDFDDSGTSFFGGKLHDFDPGGGVDTFQQVTIGPRASVSLSFQWDDPFGSISTSGASADTDLDIFLLDQASTAGNILAASASGNIGGDPVEILQFSNPTNAPLTAHLAITNFAGPDPDLMKYIGFVRGGFTIDDFATNSSASWGHANATGAHSIAAAPFFGTPEFGVSPPVVETFSSVGGTPILFDTAGNRLSSPDVRAKPEVTGPDGGNNTFFINDSAADPDLFPNFFGTSASAPHTAAVAALMLDAAGGSGSLTPTEVYDTLESTAIDMDDPFTPGFDVGFDFKTGYGLIDAGAAVQAVLVPDPPTEAIPVPLTSVDPLGSLIYEGGTAGEIGEVGESDSFTIEVDPGQTITIAVESAESLQASIQLFDPSGTEIGSATAAGPGELTLLQTAAIAVGGTYTVVVSGANVGDPGTPNYEQYETQQSSVFSPNVLSYQFDSTTTPGGDASLTSFVVADLSASFEYLTVDAEGLFSVDLYSEAGLPFQADYAPRTDTAVIPEAILAELTADGQIDFTVTPTPQVGNLGPATQLTLGVIYPGLVADGTGAYSIDLTLNSALEEEELFGTSNDTPGEAQNIESSFIELSSDRGAVLGTLTAPSGSQFEASQTRNGPLFFPESPLFDFTGVPAPAGPGSLDVDALLDLGLTSETLTIDFDGIFNVTLFNEPGFSDSDPRSATIPITQADLAEAAADGTITVVVTPSSAVNFDVPGDDFLTVTLSYETTPTPGDSVDHYSFDLVQGQPATLVLEGSGTSTLELVDTAGSLITTASSDAANVDQYVLDFVAPTTGSYLARVSGTQSDDYSLVVTRDSSFELEVAPAEEELIVNGSFETGDFNGWTTVTTGSPFRPWAVTGAGVGGGFGMATTQPQDGGFVAWNGFDGSGPMEFQLYQDVTIPASASSATLEWQNRLQWNFGLGGFASQPRTLDVEIRDPTTDSVLATVFSFSTGTQDVNPTGDTGWQTQSAELSAFVGQDVRVAFVETVPQRATGPAQAEFDGISLTFEILQGSDLQNIDITNTVLGHVEGKSPSQLGVVANNGSNTVTVFDTLTDTSLGSVDIPTTSLIGDVEIAPEAELAFVTDFGPRQVWVIDISGGAPALASGINPIPVSNNAEDLSITPDGKFLLVSDGSNVQPLSVVDIASRTEINTFDPGSDHNSVEVADDGSVLVSSRRNTEVRRFTIDGAGNLTDTGELLDIGGPVNVYPAPGGQTGIVVRFQNVSSYTIPGLSLITSRPRLRAPSNLQSAVFSPDGTRLYVRSDASNNSGFIDVWGYAPATGDISATPLFTISGIDNDPAGSPPDRLGVFFGIDQLALSADGSKLYVPQNDSVDVFDASTGTFITSVNDPSINLATGVKLTELAEPDVPIGDQYTITLGAGERVDIKTLTPAASSGEFVNHLDPLLTLIAPDGTVVTADDNGLDGRNALIEYTAGAAGLFTIIVSAADENGGEYVLDVNRSPQLGQLTLSADEIFENESISLSGSYSDHNGDDSHTVVVDWDDPNDSNDSTFAVPAINTLSVGDSFNSTSDDAVLEITTLDLLAGEVGFAVSDHQYLDDGAAPGNGTAADTSTVSVTITDSGGLAATPSTGDALSFPDFGDTTGLTLNGDASTTATGDGTVLRLARSPSSFDVGSAFSVVPFNVADAFSTQFSFRITDPGGVSDGTENGADGITFTLQTDGPDALGGAGGSLGYGGLAPSVAVEFDTWQNTVDPSSNHLGVDVNGSLASVVTVDEPLNKWDDGRLYFAWIDYDGTDLEVRVNTSGVRPATPNLALSIDIPGVLGQNTAFAGFTGATGGAFGNHDIVSWQLDAVPLDNVDVLVKNVEPTVDTVSVSATEDNKAIAGDDVTLAATFTDIGLLDRHDVTIDWDDASANSVFDVAATADLTAGDTFASIDGAVLTITAVDLATGAVSFEVSSHQYATGGIFEVIVTITDDDTGADNGGALAWVTGVRVKDGELQIVGSNDGDQVTVNTQGKDLIKVHADFLLTGNFETFPLEDVQQILAYMCDGDDHLTIGGNVEIPAILHAGAGSDRINAGGGPTVIDGGEGEDRLNGGSGRNILIGGLGEDRLISGPEDDILIGGTTAFDANDVALLALLDEWNSGRSYAERVDNIRTGSGPILGGTGYKLAKGETVFDDGEFDRLTGSSGLDWFFFDPDEDDATDIKNAEEAN